MYSRTERKKKRDEKDTRFQARKAPYPGHEMGPPENPDPTGKPPAGPVAVGRDVEADIQASGVGSAADDGSEGAELGQTGVGLRAVGSGPGREQGNDGPEGSPGGVRGAKGRGLSQSIGARDLF